MGFHARTRRLEETEKGSCKENKGAEGAKGFFKEEEAGKH
jgi:hypothetical protein